ncbi:hypothetical protein [Streptosporangium nondiastaticum]|uniref:hypothetical protein n=1 Tax=Streptosporangium nondiastaticum TaxID=35764 RepID=UPI001671F767|nr:hypothetical protein [Streptosporangium nondiastaticum]
MAGGALFIASQGARAYTWFTAVAAVAALVFVRSRDPRTAGASNAPAGLRPSEPSS